MATIHKCVQVITISICIILMVSLTFSSARYLKVSLLMLTFAFSKRFQSVFKAFSQHFTAFHSVSQRFSTFLNVFATFSNKNYHLSCHAKTRISFSCLTFFFYHKSISCSFFDLWNVHNYFYLPILDPSILANSFISEKLMIHKII